MAIFSDCRQQNALALGVQPQVDFEPGSSPKYRSPLRVWWTPYRGARRRIHHTRSVIPFRYESAFSDFNSPGVRANARTLQTRARGSDWTRVTQTSEIIASAHSLNQRRRDDQTVNRNPRVPEEQRFSPRSLRGSVMLQHAITTPQQPRAQSQKQVTTDVRPLARQIRDRPLHSSL